MQILGRQPLDRIMKGDVLLAQITDAHSSATWVLWRYLWRGARSGVPLVVRATDSQGRVQSSRILRAYPEGSSGLHTITVPVK